MYLIVYLFKILGVLVSSKIAMVAGLREGCVSLEHGYVTQTTIVVTAGTKIQRCVVSECRTKAPRAKSPRTESPRTKAHEDISLQG